jgi:hypothetical protein
VQHAPGGIISGDASSKVSVVIYWDAVLDVMSKNGPPAETIWFIADGGLKWQARISKQARSTLPAKTDNLD